MNIGFEQASQLEETAQAFADACIWVNENVNHRLTIRTNKNFGVAESRYDKTKSARWLRRFP